MNKQINSFKPYILLLIAVIIYPYFFFLLYPILCEITHLLIDFGVPCKCQDYHQFSCLEMIGLPIFYFAYIIPIVILLCLILIFIFLIKKINPRHKNYLYVLIAFLWSSLITFTFDLLAFDRCEGIGCWFYQSDCHDNCLSNPFVMVYIGNITYYMLLGIFFKLYSKRKREHLT